MATVSRAQPAQPIGDADLPWASSDDPIGVHRSDAELDRGATARPSADAQAFGPKPPALSTRVGEVLSATSQVREVAHRITIEWHAGLALVTHALDFSHQGATSAEVSYRLPMPEHATLSALKVCNDRGCREGLEAPHTDVWSAYDDAVQSRGVTGLPVAQAITGNDDRGATITLRAAPVSAAHTLQVWVTYLIDAPVRGGVVRVTLPARGVDDRASDAEVLVKAPELSAIALAGAATTTAPALLNPWQPIDLVARFTPAQPVLSAWLTYPCAERTCKRAWMAAKAAPLRDTELALALDASPSMRGPARGRVAVTLAALLGLIAPQERLDVVSFAATARVLQTRVLAGELAIEPLVQAIHAEDLGSSTRLSTAWSALEPWWKERGPRMRKTLLVIGDGTLSRDALATFAAIGSAGVSVSWINLADDPAAPELRARVEDSGGVLIEAASAAASTLRDGNGGPLEEALAELFAAPVVSGLRVQGRPIQRTEAIGLGRLRAGVQVTWEGDAPVTLLSGFEASRQRPGHGHVSTWGPRESSMPHVALTSLSQALAARHRGVSALMAVDATDMPRAGEGRPRPSAQCDPRGPAQRTSGVSSDADPVSLATTRPCRPRVTPSPSAAQIGVGMPASPLLTMLRQRIMPLARACFRRDRAGRAQYDLRAVFELELAHQEVAGATVTGQVPDELRACLLEAAQRLEVPLFSGTVRARYPLRTQSEPLPEEIELTPGVAADLDRLLDGGGGALHTPPAF